MADLSNTESGHLRIPTKKEQEVIASVVRMVDRLRVARFEPMEGTDTVQVKGRR